MKRTYISIRCSLLLLLVCLVSLNSCRDEPKEELILQNYISYIQGEWEVTSAYFVQEYSDGTEVTTVTWEEAWMLDFEADSMWYDYPDDASAQYGIPDSYFGPLHLAVRYYLRPADQRILHVDLAHDTWQSASSFGYYYCTKHGPDAMHIHWYSAMHSPPKSWSLELVRKH